MGEAVNVGVMLAVGVIVAVFVGGGGVEVVVIVAVGIGLANIPAPHPDNKIDSPVTKINIFFMCFLMIEFPNNSQPIECEPGCDEINNLRFFCDDFGHATGGDDFHIASQFGPEPCHHTFDHAHISEE